MSIRRIGLVGAHRVGKTALRDMLIQRNQWKQFGYSISEIQRDYGYDSAKQDYSWEMRKEIQMRLLDRMYGRLTTRSVRPRPAWMNLEFEVADRTPIDLIGYTLLGMPDEPTAVDMAWFKEYEKQCVDLTNRHFYHLILIQPGIPVIPDAKSASEDMIEPLNAVYLSQFLSSALNPQLSKDIMPIEMTNFIKRITWVENIIGKYHGQFAFNQSQRPTELDGLVSTRR